MTCFQVFLPFDMFCVGTTPGSTDFRRADSVFVHCIFPGCVRSDDGDKGHELRPQQPH